MAVIRLSVTIRLTLMATVQFGHVQDSNVCYANSDVTQVPQKFSFCMRLISVKKRANPCGMAEHEVEDS